MSHGHIAKTFGHPFFFRAIVEEVRGETISIIRQLESTCLILSHSNEYIETFSQSIKLSEITIYHEYVMILTNKSKSS